MFLFLQYLFWFYVQVSEILNISIIKIFQNIDGRYYVTLDTFRFVELLIWLSNILSPQFVIRYIEITTRHFVVEIRDD